MNIYISDKDNKYKHMELFCYNTEEGKGSHRTILDNVNFSKDWTLKNHLEVKSIEQYDKELMKALNSKLPKGFLRLFKKKINKAVNEVFEGVENDRRN